MSTKSHDLKTLAKNLPLAKGSRHEYFRKLIVDGFFDTPKTSDEIVNEIRQTAGKRLESSVIQPYIKRFMSEGIIRALSNERQRGNFWILGSDEEIKAAQLALKSQDVGLGNGFASILAPQTPPLATAKTKILFLAANPTSTNQLALDKESREIEEKIRASKYRDGLEFITKWAVRTGDLLQYFNQHNAHIIHFSGHGSPTEELILANADDDPKPVSKAALKHLFTTLKDNIRVVVLNAC